MSSPMRYNRPVLSPKPDKNTRSPSKAAPVESPLSRSHSASPSKTRSSTNLRRFASPTKKLAFSIYEDPVPYQLPPDMAVSTSLRGKENEGADSHSNKTNYYDQENILQPSKRVMFSATRIQTHPRAPLARLNANDFPGYVSRSATSRGVKLTEPWIPANANNEQNSLHKFQIGIPSYITPPRNLKYIRLDSMVRDLASTSLAEKYLFKSNVPMFDEVLEEDDDVERHLQNKSGLLYRRKRAFSVGKNDSKLKLVRKNNFKILST